MPDPRSHVLLSDRGYFHAPIVLPDEVRHRVAQRDWVALDQAMSQETRPGGAIFEELAKHAEFTQIEFIISIRSSLEQEDEDGIWHDDGSRVLAFSLSLVERPETIEGGKLEIRRRGQTQSASIPTPPYGTLIVFATGQQGFEHKINRVSGGERVIIAGWCT